MKFKIYVGVKFAVRYAVSRIVASQIMRCCGIKVLHARCYRSGAAYLAAPFCDPFAPYLLRQLCTSPRRSARFRVELYFRVLICSEILRRAMALNSILREILEF